MKNEINKLVNILITSPFLRKRFFKGGIKIPLLINIIDSRAINASVNAYFNRTDIAHLNVNSSIIDLNYNQKMFILAHELTHVYFNDYSRLNMNFFVRRREIRADKRAIKILKSANINISEEDIQGLFNGPKPSIVSHILNIFNTHPLPYLRRQYLIKSIKDIYN